MDTKKARGSDATLAMRAGHGESSGEMTAVSKSTRTRPASRGPTGASKVAAFALVVISGALTLAPAGCSHAGPTVSLAEGPRAYTGAEYGDVMDRWTRTHSLVRLPTVDDRLTVTATYESWDFRWSYVMRYARDYRLTQEERQSMLDKWLLEAKASHKFQLALYGNLPPRMTDLTRPNCAWVVRLVDDQGNETAPTRIEQQLRPTAIDRAYFPYLSVWRQIFHVDFPRTKPDGTPTVAPNAKYVALAFFGAYGQDELRWALTPEAAADTSRKAVQLEAPRAAH